MAEKPQKREITFADSMTADKRDVEFAYVRKNVLNSDTPGLYPSKDFISTSLVIPDGITIRYSDNDIVFDNGFTYYGVTIGFDSVTRTSYFWETTSGNLFHTEADAEIRNGIRSGGSVLHVVMNKGGTGPSYVDSTPNLYYVFADSGSTSVNLEGAITPVSRSYRLSLFDGLNMYWTESNTGADIHTAEEFNDAFTLKFSDIGLTPNAWDNYNDEIIIFCQDSANNNIYIFFWDKTNNTLFSKRILERNARFIAGGVVDGRLILVKFVSNGVNQKEKGGNLIVTAFDGEKFTEINRTKTSGINIEVTTRFNAQAVGNGILVFGVVGNKDDKDDLYENWLYKVKKNGEIEVLWKDASLIAMSPSIGFNQISFIAWNGEYGATATAQLLTNIDVETDYPTYNNFSTTEYITNFLNNTYNVHALKGMSIVFEKLHDDEECLVYYRTSDREDFVLLDTINQAAVLESDPRYDPALKISERAANEPVKQQIYHIVKMPGGEDLPEYNEIQYKFVLSNGFSIIQSWYNYEYIERNVMD